MPRRDGLPTNREMVVDFNNLSRTAYIDAYNNITEYGLPAALEDKPLDTLYLNVTKKVPTFMRTSSGVTGEQLLVDPLQEHHVDFMTYTLGFQDTPEDVVRHYRDIAQRIGETTLHIGLDIAAILPPEGINADYTAFYPTGKTRHISTFKEKPSKLSISAGKFFAEQAIQSINTPPDAEDFDITDFSKVIERIEKIFDQSGTFEHGFSLQMVPNLPLNGYESKAFLNTYANRMLDKVNSSAARLAMGNELGWPDVIIENAQRIYDAANSSYLRAQALLDKK
jgi:hypothetical protein